jgi:hypothetical protein
MKNEPIIPSILTVCSKIELNVAQDLECVQTKTIAKLLEESDEKKDQEPPVSE